MSDLLNRWFLWADGHRLRRLTRRYHSTLRVSLWFHKWGDVFGNQAERIKRELAGHEEAE